MLEARLTKREIRKIYAGISGFYDFWAGLTETKARKRALEISGIKNGMSILEAAVGTGILFREICGLNPSGLCVGLDLTPEMLARTRRRLAAADAPAADASPALLTGDALQMGFAAESFDLLFNCYMMDLLSFADIRTALGEFRKVLKPGGRLVLVNLSDGPGPVSRLWRGLYRISPRLLGGCRGLRMAELLAGAELGFAVRHREIVRQLFVTTEIVIAERL